MLAFASKNMRLTQLVLASLVGLVLGTAVIVLAGGPAFSARTFVLVVGAMFGLVVVLYTRDIKRLLVIVIIADSLSGFDFHLTCNTDFLLTSCGFSVSLTALALVGLYAIWIIERRSNPALKVPLPRLGKVGTAAALFVGAGLLSILAAKRSDFVLYEVWDYVVMFLMYFYLVNYIKDRAALALIIYTILFALSIQLMIMELQGLGVVSAASATIGTNAQRITGTLYSPNVAGSHLSQMIVVLVAVLGLSMPQWRKWVIVILLALSIQNMIGTESRGAWSAAVIGIGIVAMGYFWKRWVTIKTVVVIGIATTLLVILFAGPIMNRLTADDKGSAAARAPLDQIALNMIRANPIIGVGLNNFGVVFRDYIKAEQYGAWLYLVHNGWLLIWSETGTLGMIFYLIFRLLLVWQCFKLFRRGDRFFAAIGLGLMASMISSGVHMLGDIFNGRTLIEFLWLEAAVVSAMVIMQRQEAAAKTPVQSTSALMPTKDALQPAYPFSTANRR